MTKSRPQPYAKTDDLEKCTMDSEGRHQWERVGVINGTDGVIDTEFYEVYKCYQCKKSQRIKIVWLKDRNREVLK